MEVSHISRRMLEDGFINDGPFWDKYPDVYPGVKRYERTDSEGHIIESWERDKNGRMRDVTRRDQIREELIAAEEAVKKLSDKEANER